MKNTNMKFMQIFTIMIFILVVLPVCQDAMIREIEYSYGDLLQQPNFLTGLLIAGIICIVVSIGLGWGLARKNLRVDQVKLKFVLIMIIFETGVRAIILSAHG